MKLETVSKNYDRLAKWYDRGIQFAFEPLFNLTQLRHQTLDALGDLRGARVLDIGCGTGLNLPLFAEVITELVATDYSEAMVIELQQRMDALGFQNVQCARADIYSLPYDRGSFDAVVAANVLHLVPDLEGALKALIDMLRPGGRLIVPTYCHDQHAVSWFISRLLSLTGFPGQRRFTIDSLEAVLGQAGLILGQRELIDGVLPIGFVMGETSGGI